ncbi:MAG: hypothetical protein WC455_19080 [Dehalococcoidia bacterium]
MRRKRTTVHSTIYRMARTRALEAADEHGRAAISPSWAEYQEYKFDWRDFMDGWRAGLKQWGRENSR